MESDAVAALDGAARAKGGWCFAYSKTVAPTGEMQVAAGVWMSTAPSYRSWRNYDAECHVQPTEPMVRLARE